MKFFGISSNAEKPNCKASQLSTNSCLHNCKLTCNSFGSKILSEIATEPVDAEMVGRSTLQDNAMYAGYSPADRKFQRMQAFF